MPLAIVRDDLDGAEVTAAQSLRLDLGSGDSPLPGFTGVDRKIGSEAYPLDYQSDAADEIVASHILEHFGFADAKAALLDWVRVLKPGGRMRIAVPDFEWVIANRREPLAALYLMGGQTNQDDYHRSVFTREGLETLMRLAGLYKIRRWSREEYPGTSSTLPVSLNLEGIKPAADAKMNHTIKAVITVPRAGFNEHWACHHQALAPLGLKVEQVTGGYWHEGIHRLFEEAVAEGIDWLLTLDYDTIFTRSHVTRLFQLLHDHEEIDALASLQMRRGESRKGLFSGVVTDPNNPDAPVRVAWAHFGLSVFRLARIKSMPKPWFLPLADPEGGYGPGRTPADIYFWRKMAEHGLVAAVAHDVKVGHMENMVTYFDDKFEPAVATIGEWRRLHGMASASD